LHNISYYIEYSDLLIIEIVQLGGFITGFHKEWVMSNRLCGYAA